jgi:hypothetical protein
LPYAIGFKLGLRDVQLVGLDLFVAAVLLALAASILWAIEWGIKNIRIE